MQTHITCISFDTRIGDIPVLQSRRWPFSFVGGWALQGDFSPKVLGGKLNLSVSLSHWLFAKPITSLSLSAKDHHVTLSALTAILICKSDLHSLDLISVSLGFCAVESLHPLDVTGMTPRLHQIMPVNEIKQLVSFCLPWPCCKSRIDPV